MFWKDQRVSSEVTKQRLADSRWVLLRHFEQQAKRRNLNVRLPYYVFSKTISLGVFAFLSKVARGENIAALDEVNQPLVPTRWVDQWDNLNGTIERGYAGPSIFFQNGGVRADLIRAAQYARLLASVGINGCTINNVNADLRILDDSFIPQLARIADAFRPWGVRLAVSVRRMMDPRGPPNPP
jgi:alpha-glucuronidase